MGKNWKAIAGIRSRHLRAALAVSVPDRDEDRILRGAFSHCFTKEVETVQTVLLSELLAATTDGTADLVLKRGQYCKCTGVATLQLSLDQEYDHRTHDGYIEVERARSLKPGQLVMVSDVEWVFLAANRRSVLLAHRDHVYPNM